MQTEHYKVHQKSIGQNRFLFIKFVFIEVNSSSTHVKQSIHMQTVIKFAKN